MPNNLESKTYTTNFYMRQPHPAPRNAINGYVDGICESDGKHRVNQWNDGPDGKIFNYDHIDLLRTLDEDSDTNRDPWPINTSHWELKGKAEYNLYFTRNS